MGGVRNIMVRAGADFSQLQNAMQTTQSQAASFGSRMESVFTRVGLVGLGIKTVFEGISHAVEGLGEFAKEAGELDGRLSSLNARLGASAQQFQSWANAQGQYLGISKKDMIEQGASISAMLETSISDKQKLAQETEQMLKNIAIVSSATGKSQQEVSERIVSALQGHSAAVSALDLNMHLSSLRMTEAYKQIAGSSPWAKLTAEQQQMIIVSALNQQIQQRFGSQVVEDVATRMNRFTASLSNVKTSLEQAFQPILYRVLPVLTTFINYINTALQYVTAFFQTLFGYSGAVLKAVTGDMQDQTDAANGLASAYGNLTKATGAHAASAGGVSVATPKVGSGSHALRNGAGTVGGGKKLGSGFVASFDQVHTIPEKNASSSSGGSGAGGGGAVGGAVPEIATGIEQGTKQGAGALAGFQEKVKGFVDGVKKFLAPIGAIFKDIWGSISTYFKGVVDGLIKWWGVWGSSIIQALKNVWAIMSPIIVFIAQFIWDSIKGAIDGIIKFFEGLVEFLTGIFTGNWKAVWQGLKDMVAGAIQAIWNIFNIVFLVDGIGALKDFAAKGLEAFLKLFDGAGGYLKNFATNLIKGVGDAIGSIKRFFQGLGQDINWEATYYEQALKKVWDGMLSGAGKAWDGVKKIFVDAVNWFTRVVVTPIVNAFNNIINGFQTGGLIGGLKAVLNTWIDYLDGFIGMVNKVIHLIPNVGFSIPNIPHLANGGITNGPTVALIGEAGTEVVSPLDKLQGMMASTVAQTINTVMSMNKGNKSAGGDIILQIDGKSFARIVKPYADIENKRVGTNVRLQTL